MPLAFGAGAAVLPPGPEVPVPLGPVALELAPGPVEELWLLAPPPMVPAPVPGVPFEGPLLCERAVPPGPVLVLEDVPPLLVLVLTEPPLLLELVDVWANDGVAPATRAAARTMIVILLDIVSILLIDRLVRHDWRIACRPRITGADTVLHGAGGPVTVLLVQEPASSGQRVRTDAASRP